MKIIIHISCAHTKRSRQRTHVPLIDIDSDSEPSDQDSPSDDDNEVDNDEDSEAHCQEEMEIDDDVEDEPPPAAMHIPLVDTSMKWEDLQARTKVQVWWCGDWWTGTIAYGRSYSDCLCTLSRKQEYRGRNQSLSCSRSLSKHVVLSFTVIYNCEIYSSW